MNSINEESLSGLVTSGLRNSAFAAHYQPKFDPDSEDIVGVEALLRWQHPTEGLWEAGRFMPEVERSAELLATVDAWVLGETTRQGQAWFDEGLNFGVLNVNISSWLVGDELVEMVASALRESGFPASSLALECPWRMLAVNAGVIAPTMQKLSDLGCVIVLDGNPLDQTCLDVVQKTPVQWSKVCIKYVQEFVDTHGVGAMKRLVKSWQKRGVQVASMGVEREDQLALSHKIGCRFSQGNRFKSPLPMREITYLLKAIETTKKALSLF